MKGEEILERVVGYVGENWEMYDEINDAYQTIVRSAPFREFRFRDDAALAFEPNDTTYLIPSFVRRFGICGDPVILFAMSNVIAKSAILISFNRALRAATR